MIADISEFSEALRPSNGRSNDITVDLNGSTIEWTASHGIDIPSGCSLTLVNGNIRFTSNKIGYDDDVSAISVESGAKLLLNNMVLNSSNGACVSIFSGTASVKIAKCTLFGSSYGICVKEGTLSDPSSNTTVDIINTDIEADVAVFCGTTATVNISEGSSLIGKRNSLIVRVGTVEISDSILKVEKIPIKLYLYIDFMLDFEDGYWKDGSAVPAAVAVLGDYGEDSTKYMGEVNVKLNNILLKSPNTDKVPMFLIAAHFNDKVVTLTYDDSCGIDPDSIAVYGVDLIDDADVDISPEHLGTMIVNGETLIYDE